MRRRVFIAIFGSALLGGTAILWRNLSSFWRPGIDAHIAETVKALTGLLFPGDELPGAAELEIHNRVLAMAELRDTMADGVGWFDQRAKSQGAANFLPLDERARSAAIEAAFVSGDDAAKQLVVLLRFYAGLNYYSLRALPTLLLDAGPQFNPIVDYPLTESDWEAHDFPEKPGSAVSISFTPGQKLTGAEPLLVSGRKGLGPLVASGTRWMEKYYHVRGIGGPRCILPASRHRMHPDAMKMQSRFGAAADHG